MAYTPFEYDEDIGKENTIVVCSDALDNESAVEDIDQWANRYGYVRNAEAQPNVRRNLSGHKYYYSACSRISTENISQLDNQRSSGITGYDKGAPSTSSAVLMRETTAQRGIQWYEENIQPRIGDDKQGKYVAIDVRSGDYEIGEDHLTTAERMQARKPDAILYTLRIGSPVVSRVASRAMCVRSL